MWVQSDTLIFKREGKGKKKALLCRRILAMNVKELKDSPNFAITKEIADSGKDHQ